MTACPVDGTAEVESVDGVGFLWVRADPTIHVAVELLDHDDQEPRRVIESRYEIGEWCPYQPDTRHARRKDDQ